MFLMNLKSLVVVYRQIEVLFLMDSEAHRFGVSITRHSGQVHPFCVNTWILFSGLQPDKLNSEGQTTYEKADGWEAHPTDSD